MAYVPGMPAGLRDGNCVRMITTEHVGAENAIKSGDDRGYGLGRSKRTLNARTPKSKRNLSEKCSDGGAWLKREKTARHRT